MYSGNVIYRHYFDMLIIPQIYLKCREGWMNKLPRSKLRDIKPNGIKLTDTKIDCAQLNIAF